MKEPTGELLQLSFYLSNRSPEAALYTLIEALLQQGAQFSGIARGCSIKAKERKFFVPLARIYRDEEREVRTLQDLQSWLTASDFCLLEVLMTNFSELKKEECVVITYESISEQAAQHDIPSVTVLSTGDIFSLARNAIFNSKEYNKKAKKVGLRTYAQFKSIIDIIKPAYGAITIEYPLESPADLHLDPRSLAFRNFYISQSFVGMDVMEQLRNLFEGAYIEDLSDGNYISCMKEFNPKAIQVDLSAPPWDKISTQVGKMLANVAVRRASAETI